MELTIQERIRYAGIVARVMIAASVIFIGFGACVRILQDAFYGNALMGVGLAFVALFGVAVYVKQNLEQQVEAGKTYYGGK